MSTIVTVESPSSSADDMPHLGMRADAVGASEAE
jgi:hypothetical protein